MMTKTQKITLAVISIVILILIIVIAAFIGAGQKNSLDSKQDNVGKSEPSEKIKEKQSEEAAVETQKLIDEVKALAQETSELTKSAQNVIVDIPIAEGAATGTVSEKGIIVAPGASILSLTSGDVLTETGEKTDNEAEAGTKDAPQQSHAVDADQLPESTIKLVMKKTGIEPDNFVVKAGQAVNLSVTAENSYQVLQFEDKLLSAVVVAMYQGETRVITFNAPIEKGEYVYYSGMPNQSSLRGKMIVE